MSHRNRAQRVGAVGDGMAGWATARRSVAAGLDVTPYDTGRDRSGAGRVEGAYPSGMALAETLLGRARSRE